MCAPRAPMLARARLATPGLAAHGLAAAPRHAAPRRLTDCGLADRRLGYCGARWCRSANTHLPEVVGVARGWEVTGNATLKAVAGVHTTRIPVCQKAVLSSCPPCKSVQ